MRHSHALYEGPFYIEAKGETHLSTHPEKPQHQENTVTESSGAPTADSSSELSIDWPHDIVHGPIQDFMRPTCAGQFLRDKRDRNKSK